MLSKRKSYNLLSRSRCAARAASTIGTRGWTMADQFHIESEAQTRWRTLGPALLALLVLLFPVFSVYSATALAQAAASQQTAVPPGVANQQQFEQELQQKYEAALQYCRQRNDYSRCECAALNNIGKAIPPWGRSRRRWSTSARHCRSRVRWATGQAKPQLSATSAASIPIWGRSRRRWSTSARHCRSSVPWATGQAKPQLSTTSARSITI